MKDHILYSLNIGHIVQQDILGLKTKNGFLEFSYFCFFFYKYKNNQSPKESFLSIEIKELRWIHILKERKEIEQILLNQEMEKRHPLFQYPLNPMYYTFYKLNIFVNKIKNQVLF